jgi:hydrogenase nickel incorporation protein HypB
MTKLNIKVYKDLMGANDKWAAKTRSLLAEKGIGMLNLISSPGSGKTTLLEKTIRALKEKIRFAVLEGDIETTRDAERIGVLNIPVSQLLTGGSCHLEARLVHRALRDLPLDELDMVVVENVGNLVCPAEFDIGEHAKVAVLSVTEGEDKPLKYPLLFRECKAILLSKIDLLPHLSFDVKTCLKFIKQINPSVPVFKVSSLTGEGMPAWCKWVAGLPV